MEQTEENKLYYQTLLEILYKYLEFFLSFDHENTGNYLDLFPKLECLYHNLEKNIYESEDLSLNPLELIEHFTALIEKNLATIDLSIENIREGIEDKDFANLTLALYLKKFKNSISSQIDSLIDLLSSCHLTSAKYLLELLTMFKNQELSTSITLRGIDERLMPYYAYSLRIHYDKKATANMYSFLTLSLILKIGEVLNLFVSDIGLVDINLKDIAGHLDCFNTHRDEKNGIYSVEDLSLALTSMRKNITATLQQLQNKETIASLQLDVKNLK